jgi:xanthine dehydrogenase accessory factor
MPTWLDALTTITEPAVLVTVARVDGSGPRETGAKMVFTQTDQYDTIGGGHLEFRAAEVARTMLTAGVPTRRLERFALGPSLGQCCGGVVHLAFEIVDAADAIDASTRAVFKDLDRRWRDRVDTWRIVPLDNADAPLLIDGNSKPLHGGQLPATLDIDLAAPCRVLRDEAGNRWLIDPCLAYRPHLLLFGAGHVGAAIVRALADLPCYVTWIDERDDEFPHAVPSNVRIEVTDVPEAVVDTAPAGASFLVMTHSHALDQRLAECILRRADVGWFGLIGSKTKRMQFEHRLRDRGIADARLADMVCPIGVPGIAGKAPAVIAASVVAQLLQVWETAERSTGLAQAHRTTATEHH